VPRSFTADPQATAGVGKRWSPLSRVATTDGSPAFQGWVAFIALIEPIELIEPAQYIGRFEQSCPRFTVNLDRTAVRAIGTLVVRLPQSRRKTTSVPASSQRGRGWKPLLTPHERRLGLDAQATPRSANRFSVVRAWNGDAQKRK
jgi:hypothetical protein